MGFVGGERVRAERKKRSRKRVVTGGEGRRGASEMSNSSVSAVWVFLIYYKKKRHVLFF